MRASPRCLQAAINALTGSVTFFVTHPPCTNSAMRGAPITDVPDVQPYPTASNFAARGNNAAAAGKSFSICDRVSVVTVAPDGMRVTCRLILGDSNWRISDSIRSSVCKTTIPIVAVLFSSKSYENVVMRSPEVLLQMAKVFPHRFHG